MFAGIDALDLGIVLLVVIGVVVAVVALVKGQGPKIPTDQAREKDLAAAGYDETMRADLERSTYRVQLPGMENSSVSYQQLCSMAAAGQLNPMTVVQRLESGVSVQLAALPAYSAEKVRGQRCCSAFSLAVSEWTGSIWATSAWAFLSC